MHTHASNGAVTWPKDGDSDWDDWKEFAPEDVGGTGGTRLDEYNIPYHTHDSRG